MNKDSVTEAIPTLVRKILTEVQFFDRTKALRNKTEKAKQILPFVTTYNPATPNLKKILMKHWHIIQKQPKLAHIFKQPPIVSYRKEKSLKEILVRAKRTFKRFVFKLEGNLYIIFC